MQKEAIYGIIVRDLTGNAQSGDVELLQNWLDEDETNHTIYKNIRQYFFEDSGAEKPARSFDSLKARIKTGESKTFTIAPAIDLQKKKGLGIKPWMKYAAALLAAIGILWSVFQLQQHKPATPALTVIEKINPVGRKSTFALPDGTKVNLNADSRLTFTEDNLNHRRIVHLYGEAFFEVAEDKNKPFHVISGDISTTALGTAFNVRAYPGDSYVKVYLVEGKVGVEHVSEKSSGLILNPGLGALYEYKSRSIKEIKQDQGLELAWREGIIVFDNSTFEAVVSKLERWYGVKITVTNPEKSGEWNYSGKFKKESLENVLSTIGHVKGFRFEIENKRATITF
ncbi:MAG: DUF4974 domain-containing protein [Cyclobacteriaceae bacterium]